MMLVLSGQKFLKSKSVSKWVSFVPTFRSWSSWWGWYILCGLILWWYWSTVIRGSSGFYSGCVIIVWPLSWSCSRWNFSTWVGWSFSTCIGWCFRTRGIRCFSSWVISVCEWWTRCWGFCCCTVIGIYIFLCETVAWKIIIMKLLFLQLFSPLFYKDCLLQSLENVQIFH